MTVPLNLLLGHVLDGEPTLGDEADLVFRHADALRRRRARLLLAAGAAICAALVLAGYVLATTLLPADATARDATARDATAPVATGASNARSAAVDPVPDPVADPVLDALRPKLDDGLQVVSRPPDRGLGWRQYAVLGADGQDRGTLVLAVYRASGHFCFPARDGDGCASPTAGAGGIDYVRYDDGDEADWRADQTIARREKDGRIVAVMATGEHDGDAPALTASQVRRIATDAALMTAFGPDERCDQEPAAQACPVFRVPVPLGD